MKCRILAVEDSATQAEALRTLLEENAYDVTVARSAEQALEHLAAKQFDLVLSDVMMPGITGYELCGRIKRDPTLSGLPVVLLTSLVDPMDIVRGLECGADNYITKPYDPDHLLARLRHVLDNRRLRRDAKTSLGVTVRFMGRDLTISSEREQILDLFISSVEDVVRTNEALQRSQHELAEAHSKLQLYAQVREREARFSNDRYRALLQNAGNAIFVLGLDGKILELNPRAAELLGRAPDEVLHQSLLDLVSEEERRGLDEALAKLATGTSTWSDERRFLKAGGTEIWCEVTASRTETEGMDLVLLILHDVTSRRKAEVSLRDRERQLQEAQQIANIGSFERNVVTGDQAWSDELYRILGRNPGEPASYEDFIEQVHPEDREGVLAAPAAAAAAGEPYALELRFRRKDGAERIAHGRWTAELDRSGSLRRVTGTLQDVTERKEAERAQAEREEAQRASRAKSEFLSRMSHELRTPLNAILGFGQILTMEELNPEQLEAVDQILRGGRHLLQLINEVLDLARIEAGRLSLSLEPVDVGEILRDAVYLMAPVAQQRGVKLGTPGTADGVYVLADVQRLKQILLNFISNAIKYNRQRGRVMVEAAPGESGRFRISVVDTGPGLSPEQVQKLFAPFQRLGADSAEIEGTGLGLMVAKGLTEAMGGTIGVDSEPGRGSTFWLELARSAQAPEPREHGEAQQPSLAEASVTGTVLYVEDNPSNLRLVERVLGGRGIELLTAMQGRLGLELARQHIPDLILLDMNLPDLTGAEVLRELRTDPRLADIPVVVLSADAMPGQAERLIAAGASDYLTKPIDVPSFLDLVYRVLRGTSQ